MLMVFSLNVFIYESSSGYDLYSGSVRYVGDIVKLASESFASTRGFL